jgi:hypothetical protein
MITARRQKRLRNKAGLDLPPIVPNQKGTGM